MISVVTITFNNFEELRETLLSLKEVESIESVVINGGSDKDSLKLLLDHRGIKLNEKDEGISDAFNKGWKISKGQAIAFLNSGDLLIDREYYAWADRVLNRDSSIDFVYSDIIFSDSAAGDVMMKPRGRGKSDLGKGMPFPHPSMVVRKDVFEKIGGFSKDYKIAMDFDFVVRLLKAGYKGIYYSQPTVKMGDGGVSSARELQGIEECKKSLLQHDLFKGVVAIDFKFRKIKYRIRTQIIKKFGNRVLALFKPQKIKNNK